MTKIEVTGKVIPSGVLDKKFVQGENKMEKILFALPLNYGGVDMSAMNYTLRLANVAGTVTSAALVKTVADKVNLEWTVTEDFVRMPGNCRIELDGVDADGAHKFLAVSAWFDVLKNLGHGSNLPPKDEITAALESMQVYLSGAAASAEAAKKWADQSAAAAAEIEQQLQDAEDVTQALTDKTAEAQGVVDELGDMLAEADLSDFVRKTGTSVVTGDLQVPTPATEGSAVPRGYADGNGYVQAVHDGLPALYSNQLYKKHIEFTPFSFLVSSYDTSDNNKYKLLFTLGNGNGYCRLFGTIGSYWSGKTIDIIINKGNAMNLTVDDNSIKPVGVMQMSIVISKDASNHYVYVQKHTGNYVVANLKCVGGLLNTIIRPSSDEEWVSEPVGEVEWDSSTVTQSYTDAVPYQYAKAAGFPGSETIYKRNLAYQPTFFYENTTLFNTPGIVKIASAIRTNIESNLILEGAIRNMSATNMFRIVISQRAAATSNNFVTFEGIGNLPPASFVNLIVTKNDSGLIEVYAESTSTATSYAMVVFKAYVEKVNQWTLRENPALEFTSGTIPGTKVWDLKTAWGTTSRTQFVKEDFAKGISSDFNFLPKGNSRSYGVKFNTPDNTYAMLSAYSHGMNSVVPYDGYPLMYFYAQDSTGTPVRPILEGIGDPIGIYSATNKKYVDDAIATLEAKLTGKTVSEVLAANSIAASIPAAAPSLEISEEEEEITV